MLDEEPSNPQREDAYRKDGVLTTEQGRYIEDLSVDIIKHIPTEDGSGHYFVTNRQIELPEGALVSGHPDGELVVIDGDGFQSPMPDGLKWGFEHKHLGRYSYLDKFKKGYQEDEGYWSQLLLYGYYLGWDKALVCILSQDASAIRYEANQARAKFAKATPRSRGYHQWAMRDDFSSKVQLLAFDLRPFYDLYVPQLLARAEFLAGVTDATRVAREADAVLVNPRNGNPAFPCGYCDFADRCIADGPGEERAPAC
jgi:hypothetical protein